MSIEASISGFGIGKALVLGTVGLLVALSGQAAERAMLGKGASSVAVHYGDLNLSTTAGARTLYTRLGAAARRVCGSQPLYTELREQARFRSCYDQALDTAVRKVDSARLYALHQEHLAASRAS